MKKLVKVEEVDGEGLIGLLGEQVTLFCIGYIYTGTLVGVNTVDIRLDSASIVYETGDFSSNKFKDAQKLPESLYIRLSAVESYTKLNKS